MPLKRHLGRRLSHERDPAGRSGPSCGLSRIIEISDTSAACPAVIPP